MTEPLSTIIGAKILDQLLSKTFGRAIDNAADSASRALDTALGRPSKELRDARAKLDKDTVQRAAQMESFVEAATKEMQPALAQIKLETGHDHSALFQFPPFLAQVARALMTDLTLDIDALRAEYQAKFANGRSGDLTVPMDLFFEKLTELLAKDELWGPALREFRRDAKRGAIHPPQPTELIELAQQIALTLDTQPERTAAAIHRPEQMRLEAWEKGYLRGLYAECNELPLAGDAPPDVIQQRPAPRMQRVYVELDVDQRLTLERVLDRLAVAPERRQTVRNALMHLGPDEAGQRAWEGEMSEEFARGLARDLRQGRATGAEKRTEQLKELGIEPKALAQAFKPVTTFEIIRDKKQLVLLGDPGSGKSTLTRRIAGLFASVAVAGLEAQDQDWSAGLDHAFDHWHTPIRITLSRWAKRLPAKTSGVADNLIEECLHVLREAGNVGDNRLRTYLNDRLNANPPSAALLLDGLDEVTDAKRREKLLAAVEDFCQTHPNVPLIVTCRARPYTEDASYRLPLPAFTLAPLSDDSVANFLRRWHEELVAANRYQAEAAAQARRRLEEAIGDPERSDLRRLADTPLLLTMMARVNYDKGLPGSRAMLYEGYVNQLLYEWEKKNRTIGVRTRTWRSCSKRLDWASMT